MKILGVFEDVRKRISQVSPKNAFEFIVAAMEELEKLKLPGARKSELLHQFVEESIKEPGSDETDTVKKELVNMKDSGMIQPFVDMICKAAKRAFKLNKKRLFSGELCQCFPVK